jgi:hypothetical protein
MPGHEIEVSTMVDISTMSSASGTHPSPIIPSSRNVMMDMNAPIMKISPWAKLIMPMMPYTIV